MMPDMGYRGDDGLLYAVMEGREYRLWRNPEEPRYDGSEPVIAFQMLRDNGEWVNLCEGRVIGTEAEYEMIIEPMAEEIFEMGIAEEIFEKMREKRGA